MRYSKIIIAKLLLSCAAALASRFNRTTPGRIGFALGNRRISGDCKSQADYELDLEALARESAGRTVRTYAAAECETAAKLLPAASREGFQAVLGIWLSDEQDWAADKASLAELVPQFREQVYGVTVGSETLYRGEISAQDLLMKIEEIRDLLPTVKRVGTADTWNVFVDGTADPVLEGNVSLVLANNFPFWQPENPPIQTFRTEVSRVTRYIEQKRQSVRLPAVDIWIGETGWPTDGGSDNGRAMASTEFADYYFHDGICTQANKGSNIFVFEALDEPWKPSVMGIDESHWGVLYSNRTPKYNLLCERNSSTTYYMPTSSVACF
ncbi:putative glucan 1,3-beta-glucosidase [Hortaea werneckii]|nr:putative glucan 1,3-beta-glucosidase [Hortaea werneckii]KAI7208561.1 putative glucan 1,3-beta-glucosidase [Hortaea werneckii]KAI7301913.1 putative glucan 1,3-beta-glucosidase [Hortaea werneckii]